MNPEAIRSLLAQQPFMPFAICMSSGERHEIRHPECVALGRSRLIITFPEDNDRFVICALIHVNAVEQLQAS